jgi:hypothetical protein
MVTLFQSCVALEIGLEIIQRRGEEEKAVSKNGYLQKGGLEIPCILTPLYLYRTVTLFGVFDGQNQG